MTCVNARSARGLGSKRPLPPVEFALTRVSSGVNRPEVSGGLPQCPATGSMVLAGASAWPVIPAWSAAPTCCSAYLADGVAIGHGVGGVATAASSPASVGSPPCLPEPSDTRLIPRRPAN